MVLLRNIPWPRVLAESAIIVASILLALWVDAWWGDRQRGVEEELILVSLHQELQHVQRSFDDNRIYVEALRESTLRLANASINAEVELTDDAVDKLILDVLWNVEPSFTNAPVLESLVEGGDIDLISNGELRRYLGAFVVNLSGFREAIRRESDFYNSTFLPFLQKHVAMAQIYSLESRTPGFPEQVYPSYDLVPLESKVSNRGALHNSEFQNLQLHRLTTLINVLSWQADEIDPQLKNLIELIRKELDT